MEIKKGYKVKIYPNKQQQELFNQTFGACRYVYNHFLARKRDLYLQEGKSISHKEMSRELTQMRKNIEWLSRFQIQPLQQSLRQLDVAFNLFFRKKANFPVFKSKRSRQYFKKANHWNIKGNKINVMKDVWVRFRGDFPEKREGTLSISKDEAGNWFASTWGTEIRENTELKGALGIDLGIKTLVTTSEGEKFKNNYLFNKMIKKVRSTSKELTRKESGSNRYKKAKLKRARLHKKIANIRKNYLHHVSKAIVDKNHAIIAIEDLNRAGMQKNRKWSRAISDASWGELLRQITYKQEWRGGKIVKIGRFFPSSKTCSNCNFILSSLPLNVREWECPKCKTEHDRDINAAKMILKQAGELLGAEGGDGSRSLRRSVRVTRPVKRGRVST